MANYTGVCVYNILPDGCLNGVWSDNYSKTKNRLYNEIAKKQDGDNVNIEGDYFCSYTDYDGQRLNCELTISSSKIIGTRYLLLWKLKNLNVTGTGWMTGQYQLTAYFKYSI